MKKITIFCDGKKWIVDKNLKTFSTHFGNIDIPEKIDGIEKLEFKGRSFYFYQPGISEFLLKIKRKTQIIYPKDVAVITFYSSLKETDNVIETGTGSGSLLIGIMSIVKKGKVITIERNEDFREVAVKNIENYFGKIPENLEFINGDVYDENFKIDIEEEWADKIFFDLPEPWKAKGLLKYLKKGGILVNYNPQIIQIKKFVEELDGFIDINVFELLERRWLVDEKRARPVDLMRGHTGFIMIGRKAK
ncbi:MAG TPA: hypothetical protein PKV21_03910 [bacterium]|nr:hypothetical protein [bacterium]HOM26635.1 hypothetical protein [bacterium]